MPVLVTAPGSSLGQAVVRLLVGLGGEVRAFCGPDAPVHTLRQMGVVCASGSLLDEGHLETAMEHVHTVVHLGVGPLAASPAQLVEETATVVSAAVGAQVKRVVATSLPGADVDADDPLRRAAAEAEQVLVEATCPTTVVRASLVDTPELRARVARTPLDASTLATPVAPVRFVDLAEVVAALDDQRGTLPDRQFLGADGPRVVPLRDWMRAAGTTPMRWSLRRAGPLAAVLAGSWTSPDLPDAWAATGVSPRSPLDAA